MGPDSFVRRIIYSIVDDTRDISSRPPHDTIVYHVVHGISTIFVYVIISCYDMFVEVWIILIS